MIQCAAHSDTTFTTILATFENRGLEILDSDGKWVEVEPRPHSLVVNILLSKMSRDRFKATMHRWCTRVKIASLCRSFSSPMVVVTATFTSMSAEMYKNGQEPLSNEPCFYANWQTRGIKKWIE